MSEANDGRRQTISDRLVARLGSGRRTTRTLTAVGSALVVLAVVLLGFPVFTDLSNNSSQASLNAQFKAPGERSAYLAGSIADGNSLTRIEIPKLSLDAMVVQGVDEQALKAGAGHYPETPLPCETGDVAIAGHRTTYGKPFANVNLLAPGDDITLVTPVGSCTYQVVQQPFVVAADDWGVVANTPGQHMLTLTSCHPKGSASHRIVIKATMVSSTSSL